MRLINRPCQLVARDPDSVVDSYGDRTGTTTVVGTLCELQPVPRVGLDLEHEDGNLGYDTYKVYLPATISPSNNDALLIDGDTYEFIGPTHTRRNPRTGLDMFTEGYVRRMT